MANEKTFSLPVSLWDMRAGPEDDFAALRYGPAAAEEREDARISRTHARRSDAQKTREEQKSS